MKIMLSPQVPVNEENEVFYNFNNNIIEATMSYEGKIAKDTFDFSRVPNGELEIYDSETGDEIVVTTLPINPILSAKKVNGILQVELLNWVNMEEKREHILFPDWIEHTEYENWLKKGREGDDRDG